jgi:hypothetical protein
MGTVTPLFRDLVDVVLNAPARPIRPITAAVEFRLRDGVAHAMPIGYNTAFCGAETTGPAPAKAVPCERCLSKAAQHVASFS